MEQPFDAGASVAGGTTPLHAQPNGLDRKERQEEHAMSTNSKSTKTRFRARGVTLALAVTSILGAGTPTAWAADSGIQAKGGRIALPAATQLRGCRGPDPAVVSFKTGRIKRTAPHRAKVELIATMRNVGTAEYRSAPGKQFLAIGYVSAGGASGTLARLDFDRLAPEKGTMRVLRAWADIRLDQEFPGKFEAFISYDPDFQIDGNAANDDCNLRNNSRFLEERKVMSLVSEVLRATPKGRAYEAVQRDKRKRAQELIGPAVPKPPIGR